MTNIEKLHQLSTEITDLNNIMALLQWDQEVMMPEQAAVERAAQVATLSRIIHRRLVSPKLGAVLQEAAEMKDLSHADLALVRVLSREHEQGCKLPEDFVAAFASLTASALPAWITARQRSDFSIFSGRLEAILQMSRQKTEYLGYDHHPYDALLDLHEEGLTTAQITGIFKDLQPVLTRMTNNCKELPAPPVTPPLDLAFQKKLSRLVLEKIGYAFDRGRLDQSAHPFSTSLGHHDRRLTNRYQPDSLEFIFSALHEGGHGLYEQGVAADLARTHLDTGVSLGIHESQSRLWENIIGRSLDFWHHLYPAFQREVPDQFGAMAVEEFVRLVNRVVPGMIRVEADEVTYNLHILIRFELEVALLDGTVTVQDLPELWVDKYREYLGVTVDSASNGVLQDIHWAHGALGYFPTYTIGNLAAAQIWHTYCLADPDHRRTLQNGNLGKIRNWLTANIYQHGAVYPPATLLKKVTGEALNSRFLIDYLTAKYPARAA